MNFPIIHLHGASVQFSSTINLLIAGKIIPSLAKRTILGPEKLQFPMGPKRTESFTVEAEKARVFY